MGAARGVQRVGTVVYSAWMADTETQNRFPLIAGLTNPDDIADWSDEQLADLAEEMREVIIDTISKTGGHLGAEPRGRGADPRPPLGAR